MFPLTWVMVLVVRMDGRPLPSLFRWEIALKFVLGATIKIIFLLTRRKQPILVRIVRNWDVVRLVFVEDVSISIPFTIVSPLGKFGRQWTRLVRR